MCPLPSEVIHIRFPVGIEGSPSLAKIAVEVAFSFSNQFLDRSGGKRHGVVYRHLGYVWHAYWTRSRNRAVVVCCEGRVEEAHG